MRRNPLYVFKDLNAIGIYDVPLESVIQINDSDGSGTPRTVQIKSKVGLDSASTIADFLNNSDNYIDQIESTEIPSELEKLEFDVQGDIKAGWRILGREPTSYGRVGVGAVDFSLSTEAGATNGATGVNSFAQGTNTSASGENTTVFGLKTQAQNPNEMVVGKFNESTPTSIFTVGIGDSEVNRKNGIVVENTGLVKAPVTDNGLLAGAGNEKALTTVEYVNAQDNLKVDRAGDTITGELTINENLFVDQNAVVANKLFVPTITSPSVNIEGALLVDDGITSRKRIYSETDIKIGLRQDNTSVIEFTSSTFPNTEVSIYWKDQNSDFFVNTPASTGSKLWHAGNFDPDSKFDVAGGVITGDVDVQGNLKVQTAEIPLVTGDVEIQGDLMADEIGSNNIYVKNNIFIGDATTSNVGLVFNDSGNAPLFYWNQSRNTFVFDTGDGVEKIIWHEGTFDPNSKIDVAEKGVPNGVATLDASGIVLASQLPHESVTSVNGYSHANGNSDVVLTTTDITEGTNLYYTDARADARVQAAIDDSAGLGATTRLWSASKIQTELDLKVDNAGGTITGDLDLVGDLRVQGSSEFQGNVTVPVISGNTEFTADVQIDGSAGIGGTLFVNEALKIGMDSSNQSTLSFTDETTTNIPSLRWDAQNDRFLINTTTQFDLDLWHAGTFNPASKLNKSGDTVTGDFRVQGNLTFDSDLVINGTFINDATFADNVIVNLDQLVKGNLQVDNSIKVGLTPSGTTSNIIFTDANNVNAAPKIIWDTSSAEFKVDDTNTIGTLWHSGNINPVISVNGQTGVVSLNSGQIPEGTNLYYTDARVNSRIQASSINDLADVDTTGVQDGQTLKWDHLNTKWIPANDNSPVTSVNGKTGVVVLETDDINETAGGTNKWFTAQHWVDEFNLYLDDQATNGDTDKIWSADKIYDELYTKLDKAGGLITGSLEVQGGTTLSGVNDIQHISTNLLVDGRLSTGDQLLVAQDAKFGHDIVVGHNDTALARIVFNDITAGEAPSFFWDQTEKDFYITTDTSGPLKVFSEENFDPDTKLDVAGGTITGYLHINNDLTVYNKVSVGGEFEVVGESTFNSGVNLSSVLTDLHLNQDLTVNGDTNMAGNAKIGGELLVGYTNNGTTLDSRIQLQDGASPTTSNGLRWDATAQEFKIDYLGTPFTLWHAGTFDPDSKINLSEKAQANGVATLGADAKIPANQLPALAITEVYVVATITDRDNLTGIETGDVCKVTDSDGQGRPQTYIYDGATWLDIQETSDVMTVNGKTGDVVLTTDDITEGATNLYYTDARADARVQAAIVDTSLSTTTVYSSQKTSDVIGNVAAELDDTQTGAGLDADGNYVQPSGSNYLDTATSLANADELLDTQVKTNADAIATNATSITTLGGELDDTQTGAGLGTDGSYTVNGSANYISGATSLANADDLLDAQVKSNADAIATNATSIANLDADAIAETATRIFFTPAEQTKLTGIEAGATADMTGAEIKAAYEAEADTNAYTDAAKAKVDALDYTGAVSGDILVYDGTNWVPGTIPTTVGTDFDATAGQTDFVITGVVFSEADVTIDGLLQRDTTYTIADDGTDTTVTLSTAATGGEWVRISYTN